jgi:hypothetical protein
VNFTSLLNFFYESDTSVRSLTVELKEELRHSGLIFVARKQEECKLERDNKDSERQM